MRKSIQIFTGLIFIFFACTISNYDQAPEVSKQGDELSRSYDWSRTLKKGTSGREVMELQIRIAGWASDTESKTFIAVDGKFGTGTENALKRFQRAYDLAADGIAGPKTFSVLNNLEDADGSTAHFSWSEFYCKDGSVFSGGKIGDSRVKENIRQLMWKLEALRKKMGNKPITIVSGFRSISYNTSVNGAANSLHMYGVAADVKVLGKSVSQVRSMAKTCGFSGIIAYDSFTHLDSRVEYPYRSQSWYWP